MIELADTVRINAPLEAVAKWLRNMPRHYWEWHPREHIDFQVVDGEQELREGTVVKSTEKLSGFTLTFKFRITRVDGDSFVEWKATFPHSLAGLRGSFALRALSADSTELTATTVIGWSAKLLGRVVDPLVERFAVRRATIARHMLEEGQYLKRAVEKSWLAESRDA